jgi:hypothetical protein
MRADLGLCSSPATVLRMTQRQPPHPFGPPLLALIAVAVLGAAYAVFGVGKDALTYAVSALAVFGLPVVIIFGVAGIVLGVRPLFRVRKP